MADASDVVVVGGGIGGASLACALARAGISVSVLEASTEFADRVRGESMQTWGVKEARDLGVEAGLARCRCAHHPDLEAVHGGCGRRRRNPDGDDDSRHFRIAEPSTSGRVPGAARRRGRRGCNGRPRRARRRDRGRELADGDVRHERSGDRAARRRSSSARTGARRRCGSKPGSRWSGRSRCPTSPAFSSTVSTAFPDDHDVVAGEGDVFFLVFHQRGGRRARVPVHGLVRTASLLGSDRNRAVPRRVQRRLLPVERTGDGGDTGRAVRRVPRRRHVDRCAVRGRRRADRRCAGHNDPIIGQGPLDRVARRTNGARPRFSMAPRRRPAFAPYGEERSSRMARLRFIADVLAVAQAEDADNRSARRAMFAEQMAAMDPEIVPVMLGAFAGPETIPSELLDPGILERLRGA